MDNIRKAQNERGEIPGIIPTAGWGFGKWNGPSWDSALFNLPYMLYKIRGNTDVIRENAHAMVRYLNYILTRREANGTVAIGLGDYLPVGKLHSADYDAPVALTSSIMVMDMAKKASEMFSAIGYTHEALYADGIYREMRETVRRELVDLNTMTVVGNCQSSQSIALYFGVFDADEEQLAFDQLLRFIRAKNNSYDCGFIGLFTLFHVLSKFGQSNLAYQMIVGKEFPSYGFFIEVGETAIPERIMPDPLMFGSHNHHFRGDITRWFMQQIAGLQVMDDHTVRIAPADIDGIDFAEASYELPSGKVSVKWSMGVEGKHLEYSCPDNVDVCVELPENWK
jgi:alpha-L-rhamnosidase